MLKNRDRAVFVRLLGLAAAAVALAACIVTATVPVSLRYEIADNLLARVTDWQFDPIEIPEAEKMTDLATVVVESCGGDDAGLLVIPAGKTLVVTGTLVQHSDVHRVLRNLRD